VAMSTYLVLYASAGAAQPTAVSARRTSSQGAPLEHAVAG
jgi:hypothetical protein